MEVITMPIEQIQPYERNTKEHNLKQIKNVAESIKRYGWTQPIVIDKDGVIVAGHCRYLAAKRLKLQEVPTVRLENLSPDQIDALRIVDNKTNESKWINDMLKIEMPKLDFKGFDFGLDFMPKEEKQTAHKKNQDDLQGRVENILNLGKGQFYSDNKYDFPELEPVYYLPPIKEWIRFKDVLSDKDPEGKAVHFFIDDYQFERLWTNPEKYVDKLRQYVCVATPDFSPYGDMPLIAQMWNHYRKHWVGAYLQEQGVTVIPTIRASTDPRSLEWYLDGEPHGGIVLMSAMWTGKEDYSAVNTEEYTRMRDTLEPCKIFLYGKPGNMGISEDDNIEIIPSWTPKRKGES